jgi:transposase
MTDDLEDLKRRLVIGHKRDGRSVYDETAKSELVALCMRPGVSVSRLARECGVNANQVGRWLRENGQGRRRKATVDVAPAPAAFVALPVMPAAAPPTARDDSALAVVRLHARLPNGVAMDLDGVDARHLGAVMEALGRLRCSVSTKT